MSFDKIFDLTAGTLEECILIFIICVVYSLYIINSCPHQESQSRVGLLLFLADLVFLLCSTRARCR